MDRGGYRSIDLAVLTDPGGAELRRKINLSLVCLGIKSVDGDEFAALVDLSNIAVAISIEKRRGIFFGWGLYVLFQGNCSPHLASA